MKQLLVLLVVTGFFNFNAYSLSLDFLGSYSGKRQKDPAGQIYVDTFIYKTTWISEHSLEYPIALHVGAQRIDSDKPESNNPADVNIIEARLSLDTYIKLFETQGNPFNEKYTVRLNTKANKIDEGIYTHVIEKVKINEITDLVKITVTDKTYEPFSDTDLMDISVVITTFTFVNGKVSKITYKNPGKKRNWWSPFYKKVLFYDAESTNIKRIDKGILLPETENTRVEIKNLTLDEIKKLINKLIQR